MPLALADIFFYKNKKFLFNLQNILFL